MHKKHNFRQSKKEFAMQQHTITTTTTTICSAGGGNCNTTAANAKGRSSAHTRREEGSTKDDDVAQRCLALPSVSSKQPSFSFIHLYCYSSISGHKPPARHVVVQGPFYTA
jgi:hypothetical protein